MDATIGRGGQPDSATAIDVVCDAFEAALARGSTPRIEDYVASAGADSAAALFAELLRVEIEHRRRSGETPQVADYLPRFALQAEMVERCFDQLANAPISAVPCAVASADPARKLRSIAAAVGIPKPPAANLEATMSLENPQAHATGGLGEVFVAFDRTLGRNVAVKRIRSRYAADPAARERFLREATITGSLQHPGIVPIHAAGTNADGSPFYAMRFIEGESLKEAILRFHAAKPDFASLEFRQLLGRFVDACNAIAYANSKGIIHRDIKPANIMLGAYGETLVVDWGIAKRLESDGVGGAKRSVAQVGVPGPLDVSRIAETALAMHAADSKSLLEHDSDLGLTAPGQLLGTPVFMSPEQAAGAEANSTCDVYSLGATLYVLLTGRTPVDAKSTDEILARVKRGQIARPRSTDPGIPIPLEAICLKAMATRPTDRYASAADLAQDIDRFLADEPIHAYRESVRLRALRWMRKHTGAVAGLSAAILVGLAATWLALMAVNAKKIELAQANGELDGALGREKAEREKATINEKKAETEFRRAKDSIDEYFTNVSESKELKEKYPGMQAFRYKLLERAQKYYEEFLKERGNDSALAYDAARAFFNRATVAAEIGQKPQALASYRQAQEVFEKLARQNALPDYAVYLSNTHLRVGGLQSDLGKPDDALASYQKALVIHEKLAHENPTVTRYAAGLASLHLNLGVLHSHRGKPNDALTSYQKALAIFEQLARENPAETEFAADLARSRLNMGVLQSNLGKSDDALASYQKAVAIFEKLARENPAVSEYASNLATAHNNLGSVQFDLGQANDALASYQRALAIEEKLARENPTVTVYANALAAMHNNLSALQYQLGKPIDSLSSCQKGLAIFEKLARENPGVIEYVISLGNSYSNLGYLVLLQKSAPLSEACAHFDKAIQTLAAPAKTHATAREYLRNSYWNRADVLAKLERFDEAIADFDAGLKLDNTSANAAAIRRKRNAVLAKKTARANVNPAAGKAGPPAGDKPAAPSNKQAADSAMETS